MKNNIVNDNLLNDQSTVDVGDFGTLQLSEVKPDGSTVYDFAQKEAMNQIKEGLYDTIIGATRTGILDKVILSRSSMVMRWKDWLKREQFEKMV